MHTARKVQMMRQISLNQQASRHQAKAWVNHVNIKQLREISEPRIVKRVTTVQQLLLHATIALCARGTSMRS